MRQSWIGGGCDWRVIVGLPGDIIDGIEAFQSAWNDLQEVNKDLTLDTASYTDMNEAMGQRAAELQNLRPSLFAHIGTQGINKICIELLELGVSGLP